MTKNKIQQTAGIGGLGVDQDDNIKRMQVFGGFGPKKKKKRRVGPNFD